MLGPTLLLITSIGAIPQASFDESLQRALSKENAPFCANPDYAPKHANPDLCTLAKAEGQRCPNLLRACDAPPIEPQRKWDWSWLRAIRVLADVLFWGVVAIVAIAVLVVLKRTLSRAIESRRKTAEQPPEELALQPAMVEQVAKETDSARLLTMAQELAAAGRFEEAIAAGYAALVRALGDAGLITVDPNRTNGDHLRDLRQRTDLHGPVREVFRGTEMVQFGRRPATRDLFAFLIERVAPIVKRGAVLCLVVMTAHVMAGCSQLEDGDEMGRGLGVLTSLLTAQGTKVRRRLREVSKVEGEVAGIVVIGPESSESIDPLLSWVGEGGHLYLTFPTSRMLEIGHLKLAEASCADHLELTSKDRSVGYRLFAPSPRCMDVLPIAKGETPTDVVIRSANMAYVATRSYGAGSITYFADDTLLRNAPLSVGDNAYVTVSLLNQPGRVIEMIGPWTGAGASSSFAAIRQAGLEPLVWALLAYGLVAAWHYGAAFGKRRDPIVEPRRAFVDHVRALGASYARANASRFALGTYGAWAFDRLRERLSGGQSMGLIDLSSVAARRAGLPEGVVVTMLAEAREAQDDGEGRAPSDLAKLDELEKLVAKTGGFGERRTS
jgi:hypothetical protein